MLTARKLPVASVLVSNADRYTTGCRTSDDSNADRQKTHWNFDEYERLKGGENATTASFSSTVAIVGWLKQPLFVSS
jgi:hypothetical protein